MTRAHSPPHAIPQMASGIPAWLRLIARNRQFGRLPIPGGKRGQQVLAQIEQHVPDLVLLDMIMPRMDGFTMCQRVREFSAVPIIIVTARGQDQDKVRGLDLGADDYLTKPFSRSHPPSCDRIVSSVPPPVMCL